MPNKNNKYCEKICRIAVEAGKIILSHFQKNPMVLAPKEDRSPITLADLKSHQYITHHLKTLDPEIPIISEEGEILPYDIRKIWNKFWLIDPLDGTKDFLDGSDEFTVNIALIENQEPILGVIYVPAKNLLYYAEKGQGSWKKERDKPRVRIFSTYPKLNQSLVVVESRSHPSAELEHFLSNLSVKKRVRAGSSLKFCLVSEGAADIYPRMTPTMEWDVAAGDCIYRNSAPIGQRFSPLIYNKPSLRNDNFVIGIELCASYY